MNYFRFLILFMSISITAFSGEEVRLSDVSNKLEEQSGAGVAVSPSHVHFTVTPGSSQTAKVTINNDTDRPGKFKISFNDFNMDGYGKSAFIPAGEGDHSLSKWANVSPSFVELKPGEKKEIIVTLSIPEDSPGANKAAWSVMLIEQAEARETIDPGSGDEKIAFGIIPTFAFGIFLYQNPPTVEINKVDIVDFKLNQEEEKNFLRIDIENVGDGITYCTAYVELTNLKTGDSQKLLVKKFTIVPGLTREFNFPLPEDLPSGDYSAVSVLDFGSSEELQAAELEFKL